MKKLTAILLVLVAAMTMGCSQRVPTGYKGKIVTADGPTAELLGTGNHICYWRDVMYLIDESTVATTEKLNILTSDKINISVDVKIRATPDLSSANFDYLMEKMGAKFTQIDGSEYRLQSDLIYKTFIATEVRPLIRSTINKYPINEVAENRDKIGAELTDAIKKNMKNLPMNIDVVRLSNVDFPEAITQAKVNAMKRKEDLNQETAQMALDLMKLDNRQKLAEKEKIVRMKEAEAEKIYNVIVGNSLTPSYLKLREIEANLALYKNTGAGDKVIFNAPANSSYMVGK